jgi:photosystem II stability/assembly factor-like uncharacterized protein
MPPRTAVLGLALVLALPRLALSGGPDLARWIDEGNGTLAGVEARASRRPAPPPSERGNEGDSLFRRWQWLIGPRVYPSGQLFNIAARNRLEIERFRAAMRSGAAGTSSWAPIGPIRYELGPQGYTGGLGRINAIAFPPGEPGTLYAGAPTGGLWKTTDGGATWVPLTDQVPFAGVSGIAVDPSNPSKIYLLTGDGDGRTLASIGVLVSADGGRTWSRTGLAWAPRQSVYGYKLAIDPGDPSILFAATTSGIFRTRDGGASWLRVLPGSFRDLELEPGTPSTVYAATAREIYRSVDSGNHWRRLRSDLPPSSPAIARIALAVTPARPGMLYALYGGDTGFLGLYRSLDHGASFTLRSKRPNILGYERSGLDRQSQAWYDLALAVSPIDPNRVHAGGINTWKSLDGGVTWANTSYWIETRAGRRYTHADIHALEFRGEALLCGSDGGVYRAGVGGVGDIGDGWDSLSNGLQILEAYRICLAGASPPYVGSQDNGSDRLSGDTAIQVAGADGMQCRIDPRDPDTFYVASGSSSWLARSSDRGASFVTITPEDAGGGEWVTPYVLRPGTPGTIYAGYADLWRTTDQGDHWVDLSRGKIGQEDAVQVAAGRSLPTVLYVAKATSLYVSRDGGRTWADRSAGLPVRQAQISNVAVSPDDARTAWVTFSGYSEGNKVYRTIDAGAHWTNVSAGLPNLPADTVVAASGSRSGTVYVGMDIGVYVQEAGGSSWSLFSNGLPDVIVTDLEIHEDEGKIYAATYGRGIWRTDLAGPSRSSAP